MAATHADRNALAENQTFIDRVTGAVLVQANVVGTESMAGGANVQKAQKRTQLVGAVLRQPEEFGAQFARAAAGSALADTVYATAGTANLAALTDTALNNYVAAAWDVLAGVQPWERA